MNRTLHVLSTSAFLAAAALLGLPTEARSQGVTTGAIAGAVTDQDGRPLEGAQVQVVDTRTGISSGAITNEAGRYFVPYLQPGGPYLVRVQLIGYRTVERADVRVTLSQTESLDVRMETQAVELEALSVSIEGSPVFSQTRTGTATTIAEGEIESFPTISRQVNDFALLSPQVTTVGGAPSIAGQNNRFNNIQIDGAVNNDVFGLADSGLPGGQANAKAISLEAIEEFQILTAPYDVRHSNFTGGLINAVTKSGTNEWSFSGFGHWTGCQSDFLFFGESCLVSDLETSTGGVEEFGQFTDTQFGYSLGGPIQRDRIFFFSAGEFEIRDEPTLFGIVPGGPAGDDAQSLAIDPADAARMISILQNQYGVDPGTTASVTLENPRTNLFGRFDFVLGDRHRLVLRHNYSRARIDLAPFRAPFSYALSSNIAPFLSTTNSTVAQLYSTLSDRWSNEAILNVEFIRDERDPLVSYPQLEVDVQSEFGSNVLVAGAERFSQANSLDQDVIQFTDNLTGVFGDHRVTVGTSNQFFHFDNVFFEGSLGVYSFDSLDDLEANQPSQYLINVPFPGLSPEDVAANWSLLSLGFYAQDEWTVTDALTLTFGLRAEVPLFLDEPRANPDFQDAFGVSTGETPSGKIQLQPRFGFNWRNEAGDRTTQVRGGAGLFSGRPPFVWVSNAFTNTGREGARLVCGAANAPGFDPGAPSPTQCTDGTTPGTAGVAIVNFTDEDFDFPLDFKASLGVDQELGAGFTLTAEALFSQAVEQVFLEEFNLAGQQGTDPTQGGRALFGVPTADGFAPVRKDDRFAQVVRLTNRGDNRALLLTLELQRRFSDWLRMRGSYTFSDVEDTQGLFSSQATSNVGRNPVPGDPNDPPLATSSFERQNKVVFSATGRWELGAGFQLEVTPQYFGQSGAPYSYVVRGDLNGDGYRDAVISRDNDLLYVPESASELAFRFPEDQAAFQDLLDAEACLSGQGGSIMERNSCRAPWNQRLDLRVALGLPGGVAQGRLHLVADFINLFEWEFEQPSNVDRGVEALRLRGRVGGTPDGALLFDYTGPRENEAGELNPFTTFSPASNRQVQVGLRYNFR